MNTSHRLSHRPLSLTALVVLLAAPALVVSACGDDTTEASTSSSGAGGSGGDDGSTGLGPVGVSSSSTTGSGSTQSSGTESSGTESTTASTASGEGGSGDGGAGQGGSGVGGAGGGLPAACDAATFGAGVTSTIADVWTANPAEAASFFVADVVVTAVSLDGCAADAFCQIFVQQEETYASLDAGAQQGIRVVIAPEVAASFTTIAVGDRVDLGGAAWRDTAGGRNELRFFVRESDPGCMEVVGSADPAPIPVELTELTQDAYELTHGPLLVEVTTVSGRPHEPDEIFALWDTGGPQGGGIETVTNASPFFVEGGAFTGLTPEQITDFATVTGVFGQYIRSGSPTKYETLYVRSMADVLVLP